MAAAAVAAPAAGRPIGRGHQWAALGAAPVLAGAALIAVRMASEDGTMALVLLAAFVPAVVVLLRPQWIPALFVVLVWASADEHLPRLAGISPVQAALAALCVAALLAALRRPADARAPVAITALLGLPLVAAGLAGSEGSSLPVKPMLELAFLPAVALCARGPRDAERVVMALCLLGAALGAGAVFSVAVHPTELFPLNETELAVAESPRAAGPFGEANFFALSLAALVPLAAFLVMRGRRAVGLLVILPLLAGIFATGSRGAVISVVAGLLVLAAISGHRHALRSAVGLVCCGALLLPLFGGQAQTSQGRTIDGRVTENRVALAMFADHPLAGVGPDRYRERYRDYSRRIGNDPRPVREAHSLPLEIAAEQGVAGIVGWTTAIVLLGAMVVRRRAWDHLVGRALVAALVAYATGSLFLHGSQLRLPFMLAGLLLAVGAATTRTHEARP